MLKQATGLPTPLLVVVLVLAVGGCHSPTSPEATTPAPASAVIAGVTITFEPYIYRNLQPSTQPDGSLIAILRLHANSSGFPPGVTIRSVEVTLAATGEHWSTSSIETSTSPVPPDYAEFVARGGPSWPVGSPASARVSVVSPNGTVTVLEQGGLAVVSVI